MTKDERLAELREKIAALGCCPDLGPVPGEGDPNTRLVLVGEAPGETEARQRRPFVGASGRLLGEALEAIGLTREEIWITNVVKCRPVVDNNGRLNNRAPNTGEIKQWLPLLLEELEILQPQAILCLGGVAAKALIDPKFAITRQRGEWLDGPHGIPTAATFHPSYILRQIGGDRDRTFGLFRDDIAAAKARLTERTD